jgi:hypothetical protein
VIQVERGNLESGQNHATLPGSIRNESSVTIVGKRHMRLDLRRLIAIAVCGLLAIVRSLTHGSIERALPEPYTSFAPWPMMVQFARQEAGKIDREAVVKWVWARSLYEFDTPYSPQTAPLTVEFVFLRPNGEKFRIAMLDSDPPKLVELPYPWPAGSENPPTAEYIQQLTDRLAYIKIGPREVYLQTEQEGRAFAREKDQKLHPHLSIYLEHDWPRYFGVPAGWNMHYDGDSSHASLWILGDNSHDLMLRVDGATGKVLARELDFVQLKITPTIEAPVTLAPIPTPPSAP